MSVVRTSCHEEGFAYRFHLLADGFYFRRGKIWKLEHKYFIDIYYLCHDLTQVFVKGGNIPRRGELSSQRRAFLYLRLLPYGPYSHCEASAYKRPIS